MKTLDDMFSEEEAARSKEYREAAADGTLEREARQRRTTSVYAKDEEE